MTDLKNLTILLVDDEEDILEILQDEFEYIECSVLTATSVDNAFNVVKENSNIDVILCDAHMPEAEGTVLLEKLVSERLVPPLFYFVSGQSKYTEEDLINLGATGLVIKPFDFNDLVTRISSDIGEQKKTA